MSSPAGDARNRADLSAFSNQHRNAKAEQWARAVKVAREDDEVDAVALCSRFGRSRGWAQRVILEARGRR